MSNATLGFQIDSSQASAAAANLDELAASANKTTVAVDKLEAEAATLGASLGKTGRGAREVQAPVESLGRTLAQQDDHVRAFRMEVERLTAKFQPAAAATKAYEASVSEIERAHRMGILSATQMQRALDAERMAYERLKTSAAAAGGAMKAANSNAPSGNVNRMNTANIGFQFQDIAVTSAMGMNPLMIGLQQGTQLASVLGSMERPVAGLAAAFGSLINPVSLITIGLTAGTAALIQYFMTGEDGAGEMNDDLKAQLEIITTVADRWGDAVPALREYADELVRAKEAAEDAAAVDILKADILSGVKKEAVDVTLSISDLVLQLQQAGEETEVILALQRAFSQFKDAAEGGKLTLSEVTAVQDALSTAINSTGLPALSGFREEFDKLAESALGASIRVDEVINKMAGLNGSPLGTLSPLFSENGRLYSPEDFMPWGNAPIPRPRPNIELAGDGSTSGPAMILNSDGRLVPVPTPGTRPNFFEQQAITMPAFSGTRTGANSWDRSILLEEARRNELGSMFKGFITDFGSVLRESGGDLGKALMQSLSNAMMAAASQAWDKFASLASTALVNLVLGQPSAGLLNKGIGFTGANTTYGDFIGAGGGLFPANQNVPAAMAAIPGGDIASYITQAATKRGIDPNIALRVAQSEGGLNSWNLQSGVIKNGIREDSWGPYQLYMNGGLGNQFMAKTGLDPRLAQNGPAGVDFALDYASQNGWGSWYGAGKAGIGNWEGIGTGTEAISKLGSAATTATKGLDTFGGGLGKLGSTLSNVSVGAGNGGGGGGIFGWLSGLFGGQSQWNLAASGAITGLFANGTDYAPGGLAVVGERGPELVNLPEGSRVFSNHKSMDMMRDSKVGGITRPILNVIVQGASGDSHIRELARQGAQEVLFQYDQNQTRGGFGQQQQNYAKRKG